MVESYCDNEDRVKAQLLLDRDQQVMDVHYYQEKKVIDLQIIEQDSLDVNLMDQDDVMSHYHVAMD